LTVLDSDHIQAQPLKFILVGVEKHSVIRSWEDPMQRWDLYTGMPGYAFQPGFFGQEWQTQLWHSTWSLFCSWSPQDTYVISCLLLACGRSQHRGNFMAQCWKMNEAIRKWDRS